MAAGLFKNAEGKRMLVKKEGKELTQLIYHQGQEGIERAVTLLLMHM